jgi:ribosomal protein L11 methyltransferase
VSLVIEAAADEAGPLSDALLELGASSVSVEDAAAGTPEEQPLFEAPGAAPAPWGRSVLRALCAPEADCAALVAAAAERAGLAVPPAFDTETVADADWVRVTQAQFQPARVDDRLWIVPSWCAPPDPDAVNIVLDPGLAFGTGSHPTTRMCLRWLVRNVRGGAVVLDYGCGSGILAIAAVKLGAGSAVGVDIDPAAVATARANAAANAVPVRFQDAEAPLDVDADLVVANILANPLKVLAPLFARHTRGGGRLALAGLLESQVAEVSDAYAQWFEMRIFDVAEQWAVLEGVRRWR